MTVAEAVAKVSVLSYAASDHGQNPSASPPSSPLPDRSAGALAALMCSPGYPEPPIWREIFRFLRNPRKPVVLAMCRPDKKTNVVALIQAFGGSPLLRHLSNLVLILVRVLRSDRPFTAGRAATLYPFTVWALPPFVPA